MLQRYGLGWWALQLPTVCFIVGSSSFRQFERQVSMNAWQTKLKYEHVSRLLSSERAEAVEQHQLSSRHVSFLSSADALLLERSVRVSRLNLHCDGEAKRLVLSVVVLSWT